MTTSASLPILMYHSVDANRSVVSFPPDRFGLQMEWLHAQGCRCISLGELTRSMAAGNALPERSLILTFDDGYESLYSEVFPVLQQYGFSATVFLVADYCGRDNNWPGQLSIIPRMSLLTWEQIAEMARHGIEFGSHTSSHPRLDRLPATALQDEIVLPKKILEDRLQGPVTVFAYPYGRYTDAVKEMVSSTYEAACSTHIGLVKPGSDPFALERVEIQYLSQPWIFQRLFHASFPYYLSARAAGRAVGSAVFAREWK